MKKFGIALAFVLSVPGLALAERSIETPGKETNDPVRVERPTAEKVNAVRPDSVGRELVNPSRTGDVKNIDNTEVRAGRPNVRPDAKRDAFMPVRDDGTKRSAVEANVEKVKTGKPNLRQEPRRDAFTPAREDGTKRSVTTPNVERSKGNPAIRPGMANKCMIAKCE